MPVAHGRIIRGPRRQGSTTPTWPTTPLMVAPDSPLCAARLRSGRHLHARGRALKRGQPLDAAAIAGPKRRDIASAPLLRRYPRDDLSPVPAIITVRLEDTIGVTTATNIDLTGRYPIAADLPALGPG